MRFVLAFEWVLLPVSDFFFSFLSIFLFPKFISNHQREYRASQQSSAVAALYDFLCGDYRATRINIIMKSLLFGVAPISRLLLNRVRAGWG